MGEHDLVEIIEGALLAAAEALTKRELAQLFDDLHGWGRAGGRNRQGAGPGAAESSLW